MKAPLKSQLHAMCVCMAARLEDCAKVLETFPDEYRRTYIEDATARSETAVESRKLVKQWEEL